MGVSATILTSAALLAAGASYSPYSMDTDQLIKATPEKAALYWFDYVLQLVAGKNADWKLVAHVATSYANLDVGVKYKVLVGTCEREGSTPYPMLLIKLDGGKQVYGAAPGTYNRLYTLEQLQCAAINIRGQF